MLIACVVADYHVHRNRAKKRATSSHKGATLQNKAFYADLGWDVASCLRPLCRLRSGATRAWSVVNPDLWRP